MIKPLAFAAIAEGATGLALMLIPSFVGRLLMGVELSGITIVVGRVAGIALVSLAIACWPNKQSTRSALSAMLMYGVLVTLYLTFLGFRGEWVGPLLWPAVLLHVVIAISLSRAWFISSKTDGPNTRPSQY